jgi:SurA-like protein
MKDMIMKKISLFVVAALAATVMNAGEKAATTKEIKKAAPPKVVASAKGKKIQNIKLTPEMMKQIQMQQTKPIDWSFLPENVAEINGKKITKKDLISFFEEQIKMMPYPVKITTAQVKKFAPQLVDQLVSQQLLTELATKAGFKPSAKMVEASIKTKLKEMKPEQLQMMKQQMAAQKTTVEMFLHSSLFSIYYYL